MFCDIKTLTFFFLNYASLDHVEGIRTVYITFPDTNYLVSDGLRNLEIGYPFMEYLHSLPQMISLVTSLTVNFNYFAMSLIRKERFEGYSAKAH